MPQIYRPRRGGSTERAALEDAGRRLRSVLRLCDGGLDAGALPHWRRVWIGMRAAARIAQIAVERLVADDGAGGDVVDLAISQVQNVLALVLVGLDLAPGPAELRALRLVELEIGECLERLFTVKEIRR